MDKVKDLENSTSTLLACALVSKQFLESSRPRIFNTVELDFNTNRGNSGYLCIQYLHRTLESSPNFAYCIRELMLYLDPNNLIFVDEPVPLLAVVQKMNNLNVLDLTGRENLNWDDLISPMCSIQNAFRALFRLNSFTEVTINQIYDIPQSIVKRLMACTNVTLHSCSFSNEVCHDDLSQYPAPAPDSIKGLILPSEEVIKLKPFINALLSMKSSTLEKLEVRVAEPNMLEKAQRLQNIEEEKVRLHLNKEIERVAAHPSDFQILVSSHSSAGKMRALQYNNDRYNEHFVTIIDISDLLHLRDIIMMIDFCGKCPLSSVIQTLTTASENNKIEQVVVYVNSGSFIELKESEIQMWEALDKLLSESRFTMVRKVKFRFPDGDPTEEEMREFEIAMRNFLPEMHRRRLLEIDYY
ncbi:hypothetical protein BDQ17DRAFT_1431882 [Cyathus striatus]|nr:hypothetical protein BDQ17DRAFT_1431882 [Cyathus striatus]